MQRRPQHLRALVKHFLARTRRLPMRTTGSGRRRYRGRGVSRHRVGMMGDSSRSGSFLSRHAKKLAAVGALGALKLADHLMKRRHAQLQGALPQQGQGRRMTNLPMAY